MSSDVDVIGAPIPLVPVVRPNGKVYRPRKVMCHAWQNDTGYEPTWGVVIVGTHDVAAAERFATSMVKYWYDRDYVATWPQVGWWRLGYHYGEPTWIEDPERGSAGVMFTADFPGEGSDGN